MPKICPNVIPSPRVIEVSKRGIEPVAHDVRKRSVSQEIPRHSEPMIIERVQVEEGFLDGLDLRFTKGLNVLIGPRGSGKTSVIELIRFCLGAPALTEKAASSSKEHALSILSSGKVTVTLNLGKESMTVSRSAEHWTKTGSLAVPAPLVLSQNEIESVGLHSMGRLRLIDQISPIVTEPKGESEESLILSHIRSQSEERKSITQELQNVRQQIQTLSEQLKEAEALNKQHAEVQKTMQKTVKESERLTQLGQWLAALSGERRCVQAGPKYTSAMEKPSFVVTDWNG